MAYEATDTVVNLYSMNQCRSYGKNVTCTLPSDLVKNTYVRLYTSSTALADNSLKLSEITGMKIFLAIHYDSATKTWEPGWIDLELTTDSSGLIATRFADGWRLYSSAKVKSKTEKWCYTRCNEPGNESFDDAKISMAWFETLQVEVNEYYSSGSVPYVSRQMFLSGPFVELPPGS